MPTVKVVPPEAHSVADKESRTQSGTVFPYFDLEQSIKVAEAIYQKGGGQCTAEQLAAWLDYKSPSSGTYNMRYYAAKHFGLVESSKGVIGVTARGKAILAPVMPDDAAKAKVEAFLAIPLFAAIYEKFKRQALPQEMGLRNLLQHTYKIVPERITQAMRVLKNSAEQAGFFSISQDKSRMIEPPFPASSQAPAPPVEPTERATPMYGGGGGDGPRGIPEAINGVLLYLPAPGSAWSKQKKEAFMKAFTAAIELVYPEENAP